MNRLTISLLALSIFLIMPGSGRTQSTGTITGQIIVKGFKNASDAVIYLETKDGTMQKATNATAEMDQKNFMFQPHVLPIQVGTTVEFLNSDAELHNVFTPDKIADKFNLGSWPQGQKRSYTFRRPGAVVLLCHVHPEMEGWVVISPTPYFTKSGPDGKFILPNVPSGDYTVKAWHEKTQEAEQSVTVTAGQTANINFTVTR